MTWASDRGRALGVGRILLGSKKHAPMTELEKAQLALGLALSKRARLQHELRRANSAQRRRNVRFLLARSEEWIAKCEAEVAGLAATGPVK